MAQSDEVPDSMRTVLASLTSEPSWLMDCGTESELESSLKQSESFLFYHCLTAVDYLPFKLLHQKYKTELNV